MNTKMSDWSDITVIQQFEAATEIYAANSDPVMNDFRIRCRAEIIRRMSGAKA